MSAVHLERRAMDALADGRSDLVDARDRDHLVACAECRAAVALERASLRDLSRALKDATAVSINHDLLVASALRSARSAPSRRSLLIAAVLGAAATQVFAVLFVLSLPRASTALLQLHAAAQACGALVRLLVHAVPGGFVGTGFLSLALLIVVSFPLRLLTDGALVAGAQEMSR